MPDPPSIHILTPSLVPYDAIGNDVIKMGAALRECGYPADVFAEGVHPACVDVAHPLSTAPDRLWQTPGDIVIYHHSMGWTRGLNILRTTKAAIIVRYHNITPARFFTAYSRLHAEACELGVEGTKAIADLPISLVLGDSAFNCEDFIALGVEPESCRVLPPFNLTDELGGEQFHIPTVQKYSGAVVNILFVGGIKPNKGHARAIRAFAAYHRHFNERSRLIFAGGMDDRLYCYVQELRQLTEFLGVSQHVIFTGPVTGSQIKTLYTVADVFLCTSEHEGFCVPLIEAMYFRTPVVAWGVTAVPETLGDCGFVLERWDEFLFASHIAKLVDNSALATRFGDLGRKRYETIFAHDVLKRELSEAVAEVTQRPRFNRALTGIPA